MAENIVSPTGPIFEAFQWHHKETELANLPGGAVMSFASEAQDISRGAQTILEILARDMQTDDFDERKLFNDYDRGNLLRMAIASLSQLSSNSAEIIEWAYKHHTDAGRSEGKAEKVTA